MKTLCLALLITLVGSLAQVSACVCINENQRLKSLDDLKVYDFVALVKITSETVNPPSDSTPFRDATLGFRIVEKFKGKNSSELIEKDIQSSCDMGIEVGDEWILYARQYNGKIYIGACDRNIQYRDRQGVREWHYKRGIQELEDLHALNGHSEKPKPDGIDRQYYPDGSTEVETSYRDGFRNGTRIVYHRNGKVWGKQTFINDSLQGKSEWFFPSGQLYDQKFYRKGILVNTSRIYYDTTVTERMKKFLIRDFYKTEDSLRKTFARIQVKLEALYDADGQIVHSREYSRWGKIEQEYFYHREDNHYTVVYYHDNGQVKSIGHLKNYTKPYGRHQAYDRDGNAIGGKDYDDNGKEINIPK